MRKQFDLEYYLEHPEVKVVTRNGLRVRIICTDAKADVDKRHVIVLLQNEYGNRETPNRYYDTGEYIKGVETSYDLFFDLPDPAKKRVPLTYEDLLERVKAGKTMWIQDSQNCSFISYFDMSGYVCFGNLSYTTQAMMEHSDRFVDGTPCWKEVEE